MKESLHPLFTLLMSTGGRETAMAGSEMEICSCCYVWNLIRQPARVSSLLWIQVLLSQQTNLNSKQDRRYSHFCKLPVPCLLYSSTQRSCKGIVCSKMDTPTSSIQEGVDSADLHSQEASKYIKEHRIMELFENLTSALIYERPENPKQFIKEYIEQLQKAKTDPDEVEPPSFFDESNLKSVFGMLDITKKGYISHEKYLQAMGNLGVRKFNQSPAGSDFNKISQETFVREVKVALRSASATFADH